MNADKHGSSVPPALRAYLAQVREEAAAYPPSLFWEKRLTKFQEPQDLATLSAADLETLVGPGFEALPPDVAALGTDPSFQQASRLEMELATQVKALSAKGLGADKPTYEHARALHFLRLRGVRREYEATLSEWGLRSTALVARYYWYALVIKDLATRYLGVAPLNVLEVGAGPTRLGYMLYRFGLVRSYCVVELPERLLVGAYVLSKWLPDVELKLNEPPTLTSSGPVFNFLTPRLLPSVYPAVFDLALNFNSFMEMDEAVRDEYIAEIYRTGRAGAVFYNVNRRQQLPQRDGGTFDSNPLTYPYQSDDEICFWEEDAFQHSTRNQFHKLPSLTIARAAVINPASE